MNEIAELSTTQESNLQPPYLTPMGRSCQLQEPSGELASYMKCLVNTAGSAVFCLHSWSEVKNLIGGMRELSVLIGGMIKTKRPDWWNEGN